VGDHDGDVPFLQGADRATSSGDGGPAAGAPLAACRGVRVSYGHGEAQVDALAGVDLAIGERESVALWGRSGSGKTTLLHVLGGLVVPTAGTVEWRGDTLASLDVVARGDAERARIAYVFQGANLLPYFTAYENVAFAARTAGAGARPELTAPSLLALVGLGDKLDSLPAELSGGEAQRVAIARALAQDPQLLLCDEPTGHLDSDTAERVLDLVDALQHELGFALALATHDADVAARLSRVVELDDGRVATGEVR
jgi:ABC-type lipoprotein export system ATPase subunit